MGTTTAADPTGQARPTPSRLAGLDGLRAIAVLAVLAYHFVPFAVIGGFVGVDVFFVISGFLITGLLVRERRSTGRIAVGAFWLRRARRLLPALVLVVAVCGAAAFIIGGDVLVHLGAQVFGAATFSSNWVFLVQGTSYFAATTPELFRTFWSLAVEEQFYLVWPALLLLVLLVPVRWVRVLVVSAAALASAALMAALWTPGLDATRVYFGTDTHAFGLLVGAAIALAVESRFIDADSPARAAHRIMPFVGAMALVGIVLLALSLSQESPWMPQGGLALVAALSGVAIVGATTPGSWLGRVLDAAPLRWIGERSYGLYLWHWPVLILAGAALPNSAPWWIAPVIALVAGSAAAALSYRFVEEPIRRLGLRTALRTWFAVPATRLATVVGAVGLLAALGLTTIAIAADPGKGEAQLAIERGEAAVARGEAGLRPPASTTAPEGPVAEYVPPPLPTGDEIFAIGDSVMLAAAPELQEAFPGILIDAAVSRSMHVAAPIVESLVSAGQLRPILVLALGTNGWIEAQTLRQVQAIAPPDTLMIVVNAQAPREWIPEVNAILAEFAAAERNVELANWHGAIQPHLDVLASDDVHPGPTGSRIYAQAIADALQRLAELPPLLGANDYGLANRPI